MKDIEFVTQVSNMGDKKIIIIPKRYHKLLEKHKLLDSEISIILKHLY